MTTTQPRAASGEIEERARALFRKIGTPCDRQCGGTLHCVCINRIGELAAALRAERDAGLREAAMYVIANTGRDDRTEPVTLDEVLSHLAAIRNKEPRT